MYKKYLPSVYVFVVLSVFPNNSGKVLEKEKKNS